MSAELNDTASTIGGNEINFDWEQARGELLDEAGIDMEKEMEKQLLSFAEGVNLHLIINPTFVPKKP